MYIDPLRHSGGDRPDPEGRSGVLHMDGPMLVFGGCYSNLEATQAMLAEAARLDVPPARMICTGDVVAYCADALDTVRLIRESGVHVIMGNCEESLGNSADDCGCGFEEGSACDRLSAAWYAHADAQLDPSSRAWMRSLPRRIDVEIGGKRFAVVHGGVDTINRFLFASQPDADFRNQLTLAGCDGVIGGHCGMPFTRVVDGLIWHNSGAIGMPANDGTSRTWYSLIVPTAGGLDIQHRELHYDPAPAMRKMQAAALPSGYADALATGLWPSCDVLPETELARRGLPIEAQTVSYTESVTSLLADLSAARPVRKFTDPIKTLSGAARAHVTLSQLKTLWFNTGTLCNIACRNCYIESSPRNDRLAYLSRAEVHAFLTEARALHPELAEIGFTGGEPFMNPDLIDMIEDALQAGYRILVLTNAMKPMQHRQSAFAALNRRFPGRISVRVSIDHYTREKHDDIRGPNTWQPAMDGLLWLTANGFATSIAGRMIWNETEAALRQGFGKLMTAMGISIPTEDPARLVLFPEMDEGAEVPEITEQCWSILNKSPDAVMCSSSRMVVRHKEAAQPSVIACTLLPYDRRFDLGSTLGSAAKSVSLNHRHCAKFCVLGGASCSVSHA